MTYIENIFLCLALPLILSLFFMKGRVRRYALYFGLSSLLKPILGLSFPADSFAAC